jgi:hypothetical protein
LQSTGHVIIVGAGVVGAGVVGATVVVVVVVVVKLLTGVKGTITGDNAGGAANTNPFTVVRAGVTGGLIGGFVPKHANVFSQSQQHGGPVVGVGGESVVVVVVVEVVVDVVVVDVVVDVVDVVVLQSNTSIAILGYI